MLAVAVLLFFKNSNEIEKYLFGLIKEKTEKTQITSKMNEGKGITTFGTITHYP